MGSVYKRGAKWWLNFVDEHGARRREPTNARTKGEAQKLLAELLVEVERKKRGLAPSSPNPRALTLARVMEAYLDTMPVDTRRKTETFVRRHILEQPEATQLLDRVTSSTLEALVARIEATGLSPRTANGIRMHVGAAIEHARARGDWHGENVARAVRRRRVAQHAFDVLTLDEIARVLSHMQVTQDPWRVQIVAVAALAGLRRGELLALQADDVDLEADIIRVRRSHGREATKTGKVREVPIVEWLRPYLEAAVRRVAGKGLLFPSPRGGGRMHGDVHAARWIDRALRELGIAKKVRFHDLRHTFATALLERNADIHAVAKMLGHTSVRMTEEVYAHVSRGYLAREAAKLLAPSAAGAVTPPAQPPKRRGRA